MNKTVMQFRYYLYTLHHRNVINTKYYIQQAYLNNLNRRASNVRDNISSSQPKVKSFLKSYSDFKYFMNILFYI